MALTGTGVTNQQGGKCPGKWRHHVPKDCRWAPPKNDDEHTDMPSDGEHDKKSENKKKKSLKLAKAYNAIIDKMDDNDE